MNEKLKALLTKIVQDRKVVRVVVFTVFLVGGWLAFLDGEGRWGTYFAFLGMLMWAVAEKVIDMGDRAYDEAMEGWGNTLNEFSKAATEWEARLGKIRAEVNAFEAANRARKEEIN